MSSSAPYRPTLTAVVAADPMWLAAGSTRGAAPEIAGRASTRATAGIPLNLDVYELAAQHQANVAAVVARHGGPLMPRQAGTAAIYAAAETIAGTNRAAAAELAELACAAELRAACTIGIGLDAVAAISCPGCLSWSLLPVRDPADGWRGACRNLLCGTPHGPRTWTLRELAAHHLRETRAA